MAFCDALLWNHLFQACSKAQKGDVIKLGPENERQASQGLLADDGLGETWKSIALSASWSFWKDLTKPHNKVCSIASESGEPTWCLLPILAGSKIWLCACLFLTLLLTNVHLLLRSHQVGMKTQDFAKHLQETGHFKTIAVRQKITNTMRAAGF
jgi:hypothetical protein